MILFIILFFTIAFIVCMKKFNYNFNGIELAIFWFAFTYFTFHLYTNEIIGNLFIYQIIFYGIYYLINAIKTKKYIKWYIILVQFIMSIIFLIRFSAYEDSTSEGWTMGSLVLFLILVGIILYMLIINFIIFIINKITNKQIKKSNNHIEEIVAGIVIL